MVAGNYYKDQGEYASSPEIQERNAEVEDIQHEFEALAESMGEGLLAVDAQERIFRVNEQFLYMSGYNRAKILGRDIQEVLDDSRVHSELESGDMEGTKLSDVALPGSNFLYDVKLVPVSSQKLLLLFSGGYLPRELTGDIEDTEMEELLCQDHSFNKCLLDSGSDCIKIIDTNGRLLFMGSGGQRLLEISDIRPYLNQSWIDFWRKEDRPMIKEALNRAIQGDTRTFEGYCPTVTGRSKWWSVSISPIYEQNGDVCRLLSVSRDITERKETEEALRKSEQNYRAYVDNSPVAFFIADAQGRYVDVNGAACGMLGYSREELLSMSIDMVDKTEGLDKIKQEFHELKEKNRYRGERRLQHKDGHYVDVLLDAVSLEEDLHIAFCQDIMDFKDVLRRLRAANSKINSLFNNLPLVIIALDNDGRIISWNAMSEILLNVRSEDALGKTFGELSHRLNWTEVMQSVGKVFEESGYDSTHKEVRYIRNDGTTGFLDLRILNFLDLPEDSEQMILLVGNDITEFKVMQSQLGEAQKLEAIGQLAGGIAHEINTPAQYVGDNLHFLQDSFAPLNRAINCLRQLYTEMRPDLSPQKASEVENVLEETDLDFFMEEIPSALSQASEGIDHISKIVLSMKKFARPGEEEKVFLDLNQLVQNAVTITKNAWKYDADMELDLEDGLPEIQAFRGGINQVILNIIVNAADAIKEKSEKDREEEKIKIQTSFSKEMASMIVTDTGTGMSEKVRERIFEPFYTTKEVGKGTGQGLSIVHAIVVDQHGGNIKVDSEPGQGTTVTVSLPVR